MSQPKYMIYPSLLDKFQRLLDSDADAASFQNETEDGSLKQTADEIYDQREQELIDAINRVEREPSEAASKGTAFNKIIDSLIEGGQALSRYDVEEEDFSFSFDGELPFAVAKSLLGAIPQYMCKAEMQTRYGEVLLYGYADYIIRDKVVDLKTTSRYAFGKFEQSWQKEVYPWCLVESGQMNTVSSFVFAVVVWRELKGQPISGTRYDEEYTYDHAKAGEKLRSMVERFIEWLELHRDKITDKKIFGGE